MATNGYLWLDWGVFGRPHRLLGDLCHCAKFGCNRCSTFDDMKVLIFGALRLKMLIHARGFGRFDPLNLVKYQQTPKGTSLREFALLSVFGLLKCAHQVWSDVLHCELTWQLDSAVGEEGRNVYAGCVEHCWLIVTALLPIIICFWSA